MYAIRSTLFGGNSDANTLSKSPDVKQLATCFLPWSAAEHPVEMLFPFTIDRNPWALVVLNFKFRSWAIHQSMSSRGTSSLTMAAQARYSSLIKELASCLATMSPFIESSSASANADANPGIALYGLIGLQNGSEISQTVIW